MNRPIAALALLLLAIIVTGVLVVVLGVVLPVNEKTPEDIAGERALDDSGVKKDIEEKGSYSIVSVRQANDVMRPLYGEPGFKNVSGDIYNVHLRLGEGWNEDNAVYSINLTSGKVIGRFYYDAMKVPYSALVTLKPGECWYVMSSMTFYGASKTVLAIECEPCDAVLYPLILDADDMESYVKGKSYDALTFFDSRMNMTWAYDGTMPVSNGWSREVMLTGVGTSPPTGCIYFAIVNGDDREVTIEYMP